MFCGKAKPAEKEFVFLFGGLFLSVRQTGICLNMYLCFFHKSASKSTQLINFFYESQFHFFELF